MDMLIGCGILPILHPSYIAMFQRVNVNVAYMPGIVELCRNRLLPLPPLPTNSLSLDQVFNINLIHKGVEALKVSRYTVVVIIAEQFI